MNAKLESQTREQRWLFTVDAFDGKKRYSVRHSVGGSGTEYVEVQEYHRASGPYGSWHDVADSAYRDRIIAALANIIGDRIREIDARIKAENEARRAKHEAEMKVVWERQKAEQEAALQERFARQRKRNNERSAAYRARKAAQA